MDERTLGKDILRDQHHLNAIGHHAGYLSALLGTLRFENVITH